MYILEPGQVVDIPETRLPETWFEPAETRDVTLAEFKELLLKALNDPDVQLTIMHVLRQYPDIMRELVRRALVK